MSLHEQDLQQQREPEHRHREAEEAQRREAVVEDRVLAHRGENADRDAKHESNHIRDDNDLGGVTDRARDVGPDRLRGDE